MLKQEIHQACVNIVRHRIDNIQHRLEEIKEARNNETKSTAGDKHETGRAIMQAEEDKCKVQLAQANQLNLVLQSIDLLKSYECAELGSFVMTDKGSFYLSIGLGKVSAKDETYFAISMQSPLGQQFYKKKEGEMVSFNGRTYQIKDIQ